MAERRTMNVELSTGSVLKFFGIIVLLLVLWSVRNVVAIILFSGIFSSAMMPLVNRLQQYRIPRALGITLVYLVVLGILSVVVILFGQLVSDQIRDLAASIPSLYDQATTFFFRGGDPSPTFAATLQQWLQSANAALVRFSTQLVTGTVSLFGGLFSFVGILVLTFYLTLERDGVRRFVRTVAPAEAVPYLSQLVERIQQRLGGWVRGQLLLSFLIGAFSYLGLVLLGVDYALSLALIAAVTELIPVAGPIIGAVPAILVAFGHSPLQAGLVGLLYLVIQQLENNLIVPKVMQRATGLNPLVVLVAVLIGGTLAGVIGIILSIPLVLMLDAFVEDFFREDDDAADEPAPTP